MSAFPFVDPLYHEPIGRYAHSPEFERVLTDVLPESWSVERSGVWMAARPPWRRYPDQGFKLHVSAVPDDAEEILRRVAMICGETATEFNHEHNDAQITLPYLVDDDLIDGLVK